MITLITLNVEGFETSSVLRVSRFIKTVNADVVCIQEDLPSNTWKPLRGLYYIAGRCMAKPIANTILVKNIYKYKTNRIPYWTMGGCTTKRCFCAIRFGDIVIANVHLCGGRFDDVRYNDNIMSKHKQLKVMVERVDPDIIAGDFNSECDERSALKTLRRYPMYTGLRMTEKRRFIKYYMSGHLYLQKNRYVPLKNRQKTSIFGGTPDWVYTRYGMRAMVKVINTIRAPNKLSDHNAVIAWIKHDTGK